MRTLDALKLQKATSQRIEIKIGDYLNQSFSIFSKHWQQFTLFAFVSLLLTFVSIVTIVGPYLLMFPIQMGYGHVVDKIEKGEQFEFNDFFIGFKKWTSFITLLLLIICMVIVIFIPIVAIIVGMGTLMQNNQDFAPVFGFSFFAIFPIIMLVGILIGVVSFLVPYLIYHGKLSAITSIKLSIEIVKNNFWYMLLFTFLFSIISQIGTYLCIVGIFASMPIAYIMAYLMVKAILLTDGENEIDTIGQSREL